MGKVISVFNNKGGVGKTVIAWNLADAIARQGKNVLLVDFDPQCNLSIAVLGEKKFREQLPQENLPYGKCIRAYLQRFLQGTGGEQVFLHHGNKYCSKNLTLVAGDFWLNVYGDALGVGSDLLTGTGLAKFVILRRLIKAAEDKAGKQFDFIFVDLPPSFGSIVRAALYSSDYIIVPCTSDNFSAYCVGLIGQMLPSFIEDWNSGIRRFRESNPEFKEYDQLGRPVFAGWVFNGFDTAKKRFSPNPEKVMVRADATHHERIARAIKDDLVAVLQARSSELGYTPSVAAKNGDYQLGDIEDMNVLVQNSLWQNVPVSELHRVKQLSELQKTSWAANQLDQIKRLGKKFSELAKGTIQTCC